MNYKVPFIDYPAQYRNLKEELDRTFKRILSKGDLILRKDLEDFEKNIASFVGTKYAVGTNSCSDALIFSLMAAEIKNGDEVITVSHTFFATIEAIVQVGAVPVLVDVTEDFLMDAEKVEAVITPRTRAIIPVHLNGRICDMGQLEIIAKKYGLVIIEDAAQALGAAFDKRRAGSFGLTGCFSFYPAKLLGAFGDAGIVTTDSKRVAEKIRLLRNHGQRSKNEIVCYGFTSRLDNLQAALLNVKFKYLPAWIKRRREIAKIYNEGLSRIKEIKLPPSPGSDRRHFDVYQNYVLRVRRRDELFEFLKKKGVETLIKDRVPNHWQKGLGLSHFNLPFTERIAEEIISLPIYPELREEQIEYVIKSVQDFYLRSK